MRFFQEAAQAGHECNSPLPQYQYSEDILPMNMEDLFLTFSLVRALLDRT